MLAAHNPRAERRSRERSAGAQLCGVLAFGVPRRTASRGSKRAQAARVVLLALLVTTSACSLALSDRCDPADRTCEYTESNAATDAGGDAEAEDAPDGASDVRAADGSGDASAPHDAEDAALDVEAPETRDDVTDRDVETVDANDADDTTEAGEDGDERESPDARGGGLDADDA